MGKWCRQASMFIFYRILVKHAGSQDMHKILDQFEFRPDGLVTLELGALECKRFLIFL